MGILDKLKRQEGQKSSADSKKSDKKVSKKPEKKATKKSEKNEKKKSLNVYPKMQQGFEYRIIEAPHVTEKASSKQDKQLYVFLVSKTARKRQIQVAIEHIFGVKVVDVRTVVLPAKQKKRGLRYGMTQEIKKAYVQLAPGASIDIYA